MDVSLHIAVFQFAGESTELSAAGTPFPTPAIFRRDWTKISGQLDTGWTDGDPRTGRTAGPRAAKQTLTSESLSRLGARACCHFIIVSCTAQNQKALPTSTLSLLNTCLFANRLGSRPFPSLRQMPPIIMMWTCAYSSCACSASDLMYSWQTSWSNRQRSTTHVYLLAQWR